MITEKDISQQVNRIIKSPVRIGSLSDLGIDKEAFLAYIRPFFTNLKDDDYLVKEKQIDFLKKNFVEDADKIEALHQAYFTGEIDINSLATWIDRLGKEQKHLFERLSLTTRQRNISTFTIEADINDFKIERIYPKSFEQDVEDFRVWERVFEEASTECVENDFFNNFLLKIFQIVKSIHPSITKLKMISHFMRTISQEEILGENSPEGIHEDGASYIVSALVINRQNIIGAESQVYEKLDSGEKELIYKKVLEPGEFIFQGDTGEEKIFGNDLWHYVTAIKAVDQSQFGIRDIIGLDIEIIE